jgi:hypothetical protein
VGVTSDDPRFQALCMAFLLAGTVTVCILVPQLVSATKRLLPLFCGLRTTGCLSVAMLPRTHKLLAMSISRSVFLSWLLLCAALFAQAPQQHTFYVNGVTGTDTPSSGYEGLNWDPSSTVPPAPNGYRTIRYAIQQALPYVAGASGSVVACAKIYVQGGQVYSAATNGEVFPIQQESAIGLEGTFVGLGYSAYPVLQPPAGVAALTFSATQSYNGQVSVSGTLFSSNHYRYLEFRGGSHAAMMGVPAGHVSELSPPAAL